MSNADTQPGIDLSYLHEYTDGDQDMINVLIDAFFEAAEESLTAFRRGIEEEDMATWKGAAHKLKGAAGYVGADQLRELCLNAEHMDPVPSAQRADIFAEIEKSYLGVRDVLQGVIDGS